MHHFFRFFAVITFICISSPISFSCADEPLPPPFAGSAGTLDLTFDSDGIVTTNFNGNDIARDVTIQSDGKIVVVVVTKEETNAPEFLVCRYNVDGSLDTSFGSIGIVTTNVGGEDATATAIAIQQDGKIIVAGESGNYGNTSMTITRYLADGSLDGTFGSSGMVQLQLFSSTHNWCKDIAIQSDGKILVVGSTVDTTWDFSVARFTTDGNLDVTFDSDGKKNIDLGNWDFCNSIAIQTDGKILLGGRTGPQASPSDFAMVRLNADGTIDPSFDDDGIATTDLSSGLSDEIRSIAIQTDGKILAAGASHGQNRLAIARYTTTGTLDVSFNTNGIFNMTNINIASSIALQSNEKIVASGYSGISPFDFEIAKLTSSGILDTNFSSDGILIQDISDNEDYAHALAIQSNGKIICAGQSNNGDDDDVTLIRVNNGGINLVPIRMLLLN